MVAWVEGREGKGMKYAREGGERQYVMLLLGVYQMRLGNKVAIIHAILF